MGGRGALLLKAAQWRLEQQFPSVRGLPCAYAQTGDEYVEIGAKGFCSTEENAVLCWEAAIREFAEGRTGKIYWRIEPEMKEMTLYEDASWFIDGASPNYQPVTVFSVYSRLMISDKPEIFETLADYEAYSQAKVAARGRFKVVAG